MVTVTPSSGATGAGATATVKVAVPAPLASNSAQPTLEPPIAGRWRGVAPTTWEMRATLPAPSLTAETLSIPGGLRAEGGAVLHSAVRDHWTVGNGSVLRLPQLLAVVGYRPLCAGRVRRRCHQRRQPRRRGVLAAGTFSWRYPDTPASRQAAWKPVADDHMTRGAGDLRACGPACSRRR